MKQTIKNINATVLLALSLCGCGNFLEQRSQNMAYLEHVKDLDELLIGQCYLPRNTSIDSVEADKSVSTWSQIAPVGGTSNFFPHIHLMDDDVEEYLAGNNFNDQNYVRKVLGQLHAWQRVPLLDGESKEVKDMNWSGTYSRIAVLNTILHELENLRGDEADQELCNRVEGEAYFLRAQNYFWLANLYGRPYCKQTASMDVSVPLKVTHVIEDRFFARSPMTEVWGQIETDLLRAKEALRGVNNSTVNRANQAAAFALLSRVYLYMERYGEAVAYADSVLQNHHYHLLDFNNHRGAAVYAGSSETIFTQGPNIMAVIHCTPVYVTGASYAASGYTSSNDLLDCYKNHNDQDLRLNVFFCSRRNGSGSRCLKMRNKLNGEVSDAMALRLPEVYLNKAEALALAGRDGEAKTVLQELRRNRFKPEDLDEVTAGGKELVEFIRDERRRELCFEGHRWFDLRRYAVNTEYPYTKQIEHISYAWAQGAGVYAQGKYVLQPYDQDAAAYVLPIPPYAIEFNEGVLTNEERIERPMLPIQ